MALIKEIEKAERNSRLQIEANCTYNTLMTNGKKYIQLNTYGSKERVHTNIVSQSMQFDEKSARELFEILKNEFNL
ncbi:hypothetical protein BK120_19840 [Paenibacillus sp. FSL A5-0031]|uniref:hypothetical protein n=1 Tax=Paenibacillus sp. FSL A5-0031 TaxID=1920420 RepID=UPI00096E4DD1|nr:hypothetical protein [Paenibacillus sp. FSL A5-0031]OME80095.1 hypothetical protein BK120_19840 [Paenibacillus sp. FSL A5-0031]